MRGSATGRNAAETKITYATMSGDQMEDLHRELDAAIERVQASFGRSYPLMIGGREVRAAERVRRPQPDRHAHPARPFQSASREQVRDAIAAARAAFPAWSARPWRERVALLQEGGRRHPRAPLGAVGAHGLRGRQEPPRVRRRRRGIGRSHRVLLRPDRAARRIRDHAGHARPGRGELERPAALRRLGRHLAVQFPARARRRARRRRAGRRQHRRLQAGIGDAAARLQAVRSDGGRRACRPASSTSSPAAAARPARSSSTTPTSTASSSPDRRTSGCT